MRGEEASVPRVAYLDGALELMSPSYDHNLITANIGRLVEAYALEHGIDLQPLLNWTLRSAPKAAGLEPDECYVIGVRSTRPTRPDLAIEVVWTHGGIDKLEIYRRLEVPEVWFWQEGTIRVYVLRGSKYESVPRSEQLPNLDLPLLTSFLDRTPVTLAIREYRAALRARSR
ncbi:MAG TPA: Uma2 family endonuclease [Polyangiales bacterium]|nr:Uma2 family endonuclease [Polyangiales bacterium]